ncbi:MAG: protein kinase domain-containing protein [Myxococcaceae bacterium]
MTAALGADHPAISKVLYESGSGSVTDTDQGETELARERAEDAELQARLLEELVVQMERDQVEKGSNGAASATSTLAAYGAALIQDPGIATAVGQKGWVPIAALGEGGGGQTFVCGRASVLERIRMQVQGALKRAGGQSGLRGIGEVLLQVSKSAGPEADHLGVLKIATQDDGRIHREIRALSACRHRNLVRIYDVAPGEESRWYLMEYFPRGTLHDRWSDYTGQVLEVLRRGREVAQALEVAHQAKLIHRDIKPKNVLVAPEGRWVLCDFGIAFALDETRYTEVGEAPRSKDWCPDWVVNRRLEDYPPTVDIYMLTKVMYAMIAGPGKNPPASQLAEPDFNLRHLMSGHPHIGDVQDFVASHVAIREQAIQSRSAKEFVACIDALVAKFSQRRSQQQLISWVSSHSTTHVDASSLWRVRDLQARLPEGVTRFHVGIRLLARGPTGEGLRIEVAIRDNTGMVVAKSAEDFLLHPATPDSFGQWLRLDMPCARPPVPGWGAFSIEGLYGGPLVTAVVVYAETVS